MKKNLLQNEYSYSIDNFRAISILLIIFGHCLHSDINIYDQIDVLFINFIKGNTALFVFITGYLTPMVFWKHIDFNYQKFLNDKVRKILVPYIFMSSFGFIFFLYSGKDLNLKVGDQSLNHYVDWVSYLATGGAFVGYWYIPFIFLFFILLPLYRKIYEIENKSMLLLFIILIFVSMIVHRPYHNANPFHSLIYYSSFFVMGFYVYRNKQLFIARRVVFLSLFVFFVSSVLLYYTGGIGNQYKDLFFINGFDVMVVTKISLIIFLFSILNIFLNHKIYLLSFFAKNSFALYFLHAPVIYFLSDFFNNSWLLGLRLWGAFFVFFIVLVFSLIIIFLLKKFLKSKSKYFIGV